MSQLCGTISSDNVTYPNKVKALSKHAWLGDEPSTSNGQKAEFKASPNLSDTSSISTQHQNKFEENVRQTLVLKMIENINEEEIYIQRLKNIVTHKYGGKTRCTSSEFPLEVNVLPNFVSDDESFYQNTRYKGKHLRQHTSKSSKNGHSGISMNVKELYELCNK